MLLWPSSRAEVTSATPPKRGAASPPRFKALLSPWPKWQTGFYLCILTRGRGGGGKSAENQEDLADPRWLVLFSVFLHCVSPFEGYDCAVSKKKRSGHCYHESLQPLQMYLFLHVSNPSCSQEKQPEVQTFELFVLCFFFFYLISFSRWLFNTGSNHETD